MKKEELESIVYNRNHKITQEEFEEGMQLCSEDAGEKGELINLFSDFYMRKVEQNGCFTQNELHMIVQKYITNGSRFPRNFEKHKHYLYMKNAEYYLAINALSDCLRMANIVLEMEDLSVINRVNSLFIAITVAEKAGMLTELGMYVKMLEEIVDDDSLNGDDIMIAYVNIASSYAILGNKEKFHYWKDKYENAEIVLDDDLISILDLEILSADASLMTKEEITREEIVKLRRTMDELTLSSSYQEDYFRLFTPMLRIMEEGLSQNEIIFYVKKLISLSQSISDKIELLKLLFEKYQLSEKELKELKELRSNLLEEYFDFTKKNEQQELSNEMQAYYLRREFYKTALNDELTGTFNRNAFEQDVRKLENDNNLPEDTVVAVMDLNRLKYINDTEGHLSGDGFLKEVGGALQLIFKKYGKVYRYGGDEFIIIAHQNEKELEASIKWFRELGGGLTNRAVAVGVAAYRDEMVQIRDLITIADKRMYENKRQYYRENHLTQR